MVESSDGNDKTWQWKCVNYSKIAEKLELLPLLLFSYLYFTSERPIEYLWLFDKWGSPVLASTDFSVVEPYINSLKSRMPLSLIFQGIYLPSESYLKSNMFLIVTIKTLLTNVVRGPTVRLQFWRHLSSTSTCKVVRCCQFRKFCHRHCHQLGSWQN